MDEAVVDVPAPSVAVEDEGDEQESQEPVQSSQQPRKDYYVLCGGEEGEKEKLEIQLEHALEKRYSIIVIEPVWLGTMTIRWIRFGNFLHKSAVLASAGALFSLPFLPHSISNFTSIPLGVFGVCCVGLYDLSWQFDPCSKYQVDYRGTELTNVPSHDLHSQTPVVLMHKNDKYRRRLHNTLALAVLGYMGWRLYRYFGC